MTAKTLFDDPWSPTLLSAALFVGGNLLWHYASTSNSASDDHAAPDLDEPNEGADAEGGTQDEETHEWKSYFRSRLENRLSFTTFSRTGSNSPERVRRQSIIDRERELRGTSAGDDYVDFHPNNSNWAHFETHAESQGECNNNNNNNNNKAKKVTRKPPIITKAKSVPAPGGAGTDDDAIPKRRASHRPAIFMSLEGDRAAANNSLLNPSSFHQRPAKHRDLVDSDENDDEEDDEDDEVEDSEGEGDDLDAWREEMAAAAPRSRPSWGLFGTGATQRKTPMPSILSGKTFSESDPPSSGLSTPGPLSRSSSLADSEAGTYADELDSTALLARPQAPDSQSVGSLNTESSNSKTSPTKGRVGFHVVDKATKQLRSSTESAYAKPPPSPARTASAPVGDGAKSSTPPPTAKLRRSETNPLAAPSTNPVAEHRVNYNARIMPHNLILVRHGQSMGNLDETLYSKTADNAIPLTKLGWLQARAAGRQLRQILNNSSDVHFIVSPYVRTVETFHGLASAWCDPNSPEFSHLNDNPLAQRKAWYAKLVDLGLSWAEDPRIREQDFGNLQDLVQVKEAKKERNLFGAFYYRFAHGESAADVFDRISTFLDSLWRSFDSHPSRHFVLVTHGISIRVLLSRYFRYTIDQFHTLSNPRNCEMIVLSHDGQGRLRLGGRYELTTSPKSSSVDEATAKDGKDEKGDGEDGLVLRYTYKKRLRVLPPQFVRKVKIRIRYEEEEDCRQDDEEENEEEEELFRF